MNTILVNEEEIPDHIKSLYEEELAKPVHFDIEALKSLGLEVITDKIVSYENSVIRHDTNKVAKLLYGILQQEMT
jgi:CO dehydrogenase/acetyl-CoA synthase delta subunit